MNISSIIASELSLSEKGVSAALRLMDEGATIPFIARYRKEATGSLDDVALFNISQRAKALDELAKRKETVLSTIQEAGKLTPALQEAIDKCVSMTELEDIYLPYKPKRRTRATVAREHGLEPLAAMLMAGNVADPQRAARQYVKGDISDTAMALAGASDIIAEWVSESTAARTRLRSLYDRTATISSSVTKGNEAETQYRDYHDYSGSLRSCPSHRYLALRRAEQEGIIKVAIGVDNDEAVTRLQRIFLRNGGSSATAPIVSAAVVDGFKRLLKPSMENEAAAEAKQRSDKEAISVFADNLRQLLMGAPLGHKRVMGIDPGFRTGCKVVCLDAQGALLHHTVIYPTAPRNDIEGAQKTLKQLATKYKIEAIAIGNGTASRETERVVKAIRWDSPVDVHVVNEAGASVYSASEIARREFPSEDVTVRGAVSIGRRLLDPMAELVKIDPKSIGVGQYQHDVDQSQLKTSLDHTVESCVNSVGINLNTASAELLAYVAGIGPKLAQAIVDYRTANGPFANRRDLLNVPRLGSKAFTQAAGFLRLPNAKNPLDNTAVHPERYPIVEKMARDAGLSVAGFIADEKARCAVDLQRYVAGDLGLPTLNDIMEELARPGRDPRGEAKTIEFDDTIHDITDLREGMLLPGIVNNITAFGAFVDLGIHHSGLVHLSQLSDRYISHPGEAVKLGQHVRAKVIAIDLQRNRISLTLKGVPQ